MAESTLNLTRDQIMAEIGAFAGYRRGDVIFSDPAWSTDQENNLDMAVSSGLRRFYSPPILPGERQSHNWSFLAPVASLSLASGGTYIAMPDDFGGFEGPITISASGSTVRVPASIRLVGEGQIRELYATNPSRTGSPLAAAEVWLKETGATTSQRCRLNIYPTADQAYTLQFPYYLLPNVTSGSYPYALGGALHAETILASCRAAFERHVDNITDGPEHLNFMQCLATSVSLDRRNKAQNMGPDVDRSDVPGFYVNGVRHGVGVWGGITYMGAEL